MSAPAFPAALPSLTRVTWAQPDTGFHVASRAGEFVGYVDTTADGHFVAFDGRSTAVGRYDSLAHAKRAVLSAGSTPCLPLYGIDRQLHTAAAACGILAVMLFVAAGTVVPAL
ncbi:peptide ABC transporter permease [Microbacterium sp. SS28]|uniref:peptide ABC transporter permease n=1 Tax=Microbacterium sp. SS28 TaxID=2919948 RepID=UPI001FAA96D2|nr:peptide ABC transporter permease [Microbacterium sp. SS28]